MHYKWFVRSGNTYNIPLCLWLMDTHPYNPPVCYVKPTTTMQIMPGRHVDNSGKCYLPYLHEWKHVSVILWGKEYVTSDLPVALYCLISFSLPHISLLFPQFTLYSKLFHEINKSTQREPLKSHAPHGLSTYQIRGLCSDNHEFFDLLISEHTLHRFTYIRVF